MYPCCCCCTNIALRNDLCTHVQIDHYLFPFSHSFLFLSSSLEESKHIACKECARQLHIIITCWLDEIILLFLAWNFQLNKKTTTAVKLRLKKSFSTFSMHIRNPNFLKMSLSLFKKHYFKKKNQILYPSKVLPWNN